MMNQPQPSEHTATVTGDLSAILTIPQVAARAGWTRWRMFRHLRKLNAEYGGLLLVNVGHASRPRWTISLASLKLIHPQWFQDPESLQRQIEDVREKTDELRLRVYALERERKLAAVRTKG